MLGLLQETLFQLGPVPWEPFLWALLVSIVLLVLAGKM